MKRALNILLIEDDAIEVMKLNRTVSSLQLNHSIVEANNGEEALVKLRSGDNPPDVILLDLNMPKMNGIEFLKVLKGDKSINHIPIIILTTSNNKKDLLSCYKIGISGYISKPLKYDDYVTKINTTLEYWSINELMVF